MHDDRLKFADVSLGRLSTEALDMVPLFAENYYSRLSPQFSPVAVKCFINDTRDPFDNKDYQSRGETQSHPARDQSRR